MHIGNDTIGARKGPAGPFVRRLVSQRPERHAASRAATATPSARRHRPAPIEQAELAATAYTWALVLTALKGYAETGTPQPLFAATPHPEES